MDDFDNADNVWQNPKFPLKSKATVIGKCDVRRYIISSSVNYSSIFFTINALKNRDNDS